MIHDQVLFLSLLLMALVFCAFVFVFVNSSKAQNEYSEVVEKSYRLRGITFWVLVISGDFITAGSLSGLPYQAKATVNKEVNVVGKQWYWEMSDSTAVAGETVAFNVTAGDVNHGLGIYDEDLKLLAQVQAMPEYTNTLEFTFEKPGTYKLMCMEYCGLVHHAMISDFTVTEKQ